MTTSRIALACLLFCAACSREPRVRIEYSFTPTLLPSDLVRVETTVRVAPGDPRAFTADQSFRVVAPGVGYEVRDFDGTGQRAVLITHDATLGYIFEDTFSFTLLPPVGDAPPLAIEARGIGVSQMLGKSEAEAATFSSSGSVGLLIADQRCGAAACAEGQGCCNGACQDIETNVASCGACGQACGASGNSCAGGLCRCEGGSACAAGQTCCPGVGCVDTSNDPFNCNACGNACGAGESCSVGACGCGNVTCGAGQLCCVDGSGPHCATGCTCGGTSCDAMQPLCCNNADCHDPGNDPSNCGSCGKVCGPNTTCKNGKCLCGGNASCSGGDTCCSTGCRQLDNDPLNCGACGHVCPAGSDCNNGMCHCGNSACADTEICCNDTCVDPSSSLLHCGNCMTQCAPGEECTGGTCDCPGTMGLHCVGSQTCCPGLGCYDVSGDPNHCGRNCDVCADGMCNNGMCGITTNCSPLNCTGLQRCCNNVCTPIDSHHCASCNDDCGIKVCCPGSPPMCSPVGTLCSTPFDMSVPDPPS